jgi:hypothetical protein
MSVGSNRPPPRGVNWSMTNVVWPTPRRSGDTHSLHPNNFNDRQGVNSLPTPTHKEQHNDTEQRADLHPQQED